jgi:hypothetical protein
MTLFITILNYFFRRSVLFLPLLSPPNIPVDELLDEAQKT